ncbi:DNA-binding protein [Streptomyces turgidiscabies]|uniref:Putative excisionase n=1 Tax=Streptomyces turgidiscabies (strain Car8) TaxID=698760 RepID=L7F4H8_STRT8|nr:MULTISPECIES: DNA-binding protein [Streptomyces]MCQ9182431.1 DNA-binding protein [Streptomyces hayashii]ELP66019.1 putative excisionase [Streptomyces turgidiscabies Car8]MBP5898112.1 DNA-binding protein [Streptomyces sp. LBUM 1488]MCX4573553.1 DNA-binding protein [Streptomyces sp. NBC_01571]MDX3275810.1 DNA-binding protein [Streptomyces scabiei]
MTSPETNRTGAERKAMIDAAMRALEQGEVTLDPGEAARVIGCGERWLRDGANQRGFPHHRFGKFLRFSLQDCREIREIHHKMTRPSALAKARRRKATPRKSTGSGPATPSTVRFKPAA